MIYVPAPTDKQQLRLTAEQHFIYGFFGLLGEQPGQTGPSPLRPSHPDERGGGTQAMWGDTNGSASLPASARPGWIGSGMAGMAQQPRAYNTLRVPSQNTSGYMEKGSADNLVESVKALSECCIK